jgi:two-component system KDP operon response regulator KdpE
METAAAGRRQVLRKFARRELALVVGRDPAALDLAASSLKAEGFGVLSCSSRALIGRLDELRPAVIVVEALDHLADAADTCRAVRKRCFTPILVAGTRDDEFTTALILEAGADDYLREPFGAAEFVARVNAVIRRAGRWATGPAAISVGPLLVDESQHTAFLDGTELSLSPIEYRLLSYLIRHPNRVLTHADLVLRVWGTGYGGSHELLRVTMSRLRRKIGADKHRDMRIQAIAGSGYRLAVEATAIGLTG